MDLKEQMDRIYGDLPPEEIPWNLTEPPGALMDLVQSGWVKPCRAVDLGCGSGHYALWLASLGFTMTGVDLSSQAIALAAKQAAAEGVDCDFRAMDVGNAGNVPEGVFGFAYDWEVLHHVFPADRERYVANVHRMLRPGGKYFSLCFSEDEPPGLGGHGKYRTTPLGTTLYFSSENELQELFGKSFHIEALQTIVVSGKNGPHVAIAVKMVRPGCEQSGGQ